MRREKSARNFYSHCRDSARLAVSPHTEALRNRERFIDARGLRIVDTPTIVTGGSPVDGT
ncbi:MAG: hypothetical protein WBC44_04820 [Planctomycetaceae bacterium]